jgi:hypothetical protein
MVAMLFGLCNVPATFKRTMNEILPKILNNIGLYLIDDVGMDNNTLEQHKAHFGIVLQIFKEEGMKLRLHTCFFGLQEMEYLRYSVSRAELFVSTKKPRR